MASCTFQPVRRLAPSYRLALHSPATFEEFLSRIIAVVIVCDRKIAKQQAHILRLCRSNAPKSSSGLWITTSAEAHLPLWRNVSPVRQVAPTSTMRAWRIADQSTVGTKPSSLLRCRSSSVAPLVALSLGKLLRAGRHKLDLEYLPFLQVMTVCSPPGCDRSVAHFKEVG